MEKAKLTIEVSRFEIDMFAEMSNVPKLTDDDWKDVIKGENIVQLEDVVQKEDLFKMRVLIGAWLYQTTLKD